MQKAGNDLMNKTIRAKTQAPKEHVWDNLVEVPEILYPEYNKGIFNYLGIPRPIKSKLETFQDEEFRIGYFSDGLKLYETIAKVDTLNSVHFKIHIDKSELREIPLDKHLLESEYFHFENISYHLRSIDRYHTELSLKCNYTIESKMNLYANFWADKVIKDFEVRLLETLKVKLEKTNAPVQKEQGLSLGVASSPPISYHPVKVVQNSLFTQHRKFKKRRASCNENKKQQ